MNAIPFNNDFERALIVGVLQDPSLLSRVQVSYGDFFKENHKQIWKEIENIPIDEVDSLVVQDRLPEEVRTYFKDLVKDSETLLPSLSNILIYAEEIKAKALLRAGIQLGQTISSICYSPNISSEEATLKLEELFSGFIQNRILDDRIESTKEAFANFINHLGERVTDDGGTKSGFYSVDLLLHRLEGLIVLAARPGMGKTAFAINIARNVAEELPVLFFSLEQTQEQIFERMLATEAEVGLEDIRTGAFVANEGDKDAVEAAYRRILPMLDRVHVDERANVSSGYISSVARQKKVEWGQVGLIVVDYLHIMSLNDKQKVDALGDATKDLRALGKEIGCPVLLLSQLSRQPDVSSDNDGKRVRRRPELTDLRSSGEIEQSADVVIFLYRDSYFDSSGYSPDVDEIEVIVKKHRNGRTGTVLLNWLPKYVKFADMR